MSYLDGVNIKIARGSKHLQEFKTALNEFRGIPPYSLIGEIDPQTGDQVWKVDREPLQPPEMPMIGDMLYNFRSALDHLAWQLVLRSGNTPNRATEFPIFNDPKRFTAEAPRKMAGMQQAMKDRIKDNQPCFGTNSYRNQTLWSLQEYGNEDKHRTLITTAASFPQTMMWLPPGQGPFYIHEGPVQKDTILARFRNTDMKSEVRIMPSIAFCDPPAPNKDVELVLSDIEFVVGLIIEQFEGFL